MSLSRALSAVRLRLPSLAVRRLSQRALPPPSASGRRLGLRAGAGAALLCSFAAYEHFREDFDCGLRLVVAQPQQQEPQTQPVDTDVESYGQAAERRGGGGDVCGVCVCVRKKRRGEKGRESEYLRGKRAIVMCVANEYVCMCVYVCACMCACVFVWCAAVRR